MIDRTLTLLKQRFAVQEESTGEFARIKAGPLQFRVARYILPGVGNLATMQAKGMLGLMRMDTLILTPLQCDAPLFSYDRIHVMGNDTLIVELYDTMLQPEDEAYRAHLAALDATKECFADLPEHDLGAHWYDGIKLPQSAAKKCKGRADKMDALYLAMLDEYVRLMKDAKPCDPKEKAAKAAVYVEGLLQNGGPSTDAFVKALGREQTEKLFRTVLFGTGTATIE